MIVCSYSPSSAVTSFCHSGCCVHRSRIVSSPWTSVTRQTSTADTAVSTLANRPSNLSTTTMSPCRCLGGVDEVLARISDRYNLSYLTPRSSRICCIHERSRAASSAFCVPVIFCPNVAPFQPASVCRQAAAVLPMSAPRRSSTVESMRYRPSGIRTWTGGNAIPGGKLGETLSRLHAKHSKPISQSWSLARPTTRTIRPQWPQQ